MSEATTPGFSVEEIDPKELDTLHGGTFDFPKDSNADKKNSQPQKNKKSDKTKFSIAGIFKKKSKNDPALLSESLNISAESLDSPKDKKLKSKKNKMGSVFNKFKSKKKDEIKIPVATKFNNSDFAKLKDDSVQETKVSDTTESVKSIDELPEMIPIDESEIPETGTASMKTVSDSPTINETQLSETEETSLMQEVELSTEIKDLKENHDKLDQLLKEKSEELNKAQNSLDSELKNRKDFNKVKDLLEKELADTKDSVRKARVELGDSESENESNKKRINQLEDKVTKLEKDILQKENEADDLTKRLQTFASPSTASTPPSSAQDQQGGDEAQQSEDQENGSESGANASVDAVQTPDQTLDSEPEPNQATESKPIEETEQAEQNPEKDPETEIAPSNEETTEPENSPDEQTMEPASQEVDGQPEAESKDIPETEPTEEQSKKDNENQTESENADDNAPIINALNEIKQDRDVYEEDIEVDIVIVKENSDSDKTLTGAVDNNETDRDIESDIDETGLVLTTDDEDEPDDQSDQKESFLKLTPDIIENETTDESASNDQSDNQKNPLKSDEQIDNGQNQNNGDNVDTESPGDKPIEEQP